MAKKIIIDSELLEANNTELKEYANNCTYECAKEAGYEGTKEEFDQLLAYNPKSEINNLSDRVINKPNTAEVGQFIAVKTVDENGKPTEFEAVSALNDNNNVLTKTNMTEYTPTEDYHPSTKKYVDSAIEAAINAAIAASY